MVLRHLMVNQPNYRVRFQFQTGQEQRPLEDMRRKGCWRRARRRGRGARRDGAVRRGPRSADEA